MAEQKLFAGHAVRRIRRATGLTQAAMAEVLQVSPSYLNLIERNQRPLTASIMLRLADRYDFDPRTLTGAAPGGGVEAIRRRLSDPMFEDLDIDRAAIADWIASAPEAAEAFARAFDRAGGATGPARDAVSEVRAEIERWRNHFADLDIQAETLADELRLASGDLYGAIADRLRIKHELSIRILPIDIMPDRLRRLDLSRHLDQEPIDLRHPPLWRIGGLGDGAEERESSDWIDAPDDLNLQALQIALWKLTQLKFDEALEDYYDHKKANLSEFLRDDRNKLSWGRLAAFICCMCHTWVVFSRTLNDKITFEELVLYAVTWSGSMVLLQAIDAWKGGRQQWPQPPPTQEPTK